MTVGIRIREICRKTGKIRIRDKQEDRETGRIGRRGDSRKQRGWGAEDTATGAGLWRGAGNRELKGRKGHG